jgi:hypothetical protein
MLPSPQLVSDNPVADECSPQLSESCSGQQPDLWTSCSSPPPPGRAKVSFIRFTEGTTSLPCHTLAFWPYIDSVAVIFRNDISACNLTTFFFSKARGCSRQSTDFKSSKKSLDFFLDFSNFFSNFLPKKNLGFFWIFRIFSWI